MPHSFVVYTYRYSTVLCFILDVDVFFVFIAHKIWHVHVFSQLMALGQAKQSCNLEIPFDNPIWKSTN